MANLNSTLDAKFGVIEIGILISTFLYGITTVQTYIYFRASARDALWLKTLVAVVWLLETFISVLFSIYLYELTVTYYGDFTKLADIPWTLAISFFLEGFIAAIVQSFFAYRVHLISGTWFISILSWTGSLTKAGMTLTICVLGSKAKTIVEYETTYPWTIIFTLVVAVSVDILNTASLCYFLHKMRTTFKGTNNVIDKIMTWSIETGLITTVFAVLMVILELSRPDWNVWIGILVFYVKLYSNSLLLFLNGRSALRNAGAHSFAHVSHLVSAPQTTVNFRQTTTVAIEMDGKQLGDSENAGIYQTTVA